MSRWLASVNPVAGRAKLNSLTTDQRAPGHSECLVVLARWIMKAVALDLRPASPPRVPEMGRVVRHS